ncbi:Acyl-CoA reductase LuxC [Enhygromyxa salina]|uniref:Acyl-CoA reductase n=1 Tax=Enhygromyxa salina TaxID=215803 RepID=A0A2S9XZI5_9BACT|nr:aldehyde dehydrogenase family protein [Enhygromyxa salina]PRP98265.1 Acyl-CoA reductase LuxC [Enhygromyxa salina]
MTTKSKTLPSVVCGAIVRSAPAGYHASTTVTDHGLRVPLLAARDVDAILAPEPRNDLAELPTQEIVNFLYAVGQNWKSSEYVRRRLYIRDLINQLGYSPEMAKLEANWIAMILSSYAGLYDIIESELGHRFILDEWIPREEAQVRAYPKGRSLHIMPGNVPFSAVVSVVRALVTKNQVIAKSSSEDPFTPVALAQSFADVDADHPVTRALSVVYWPAGEPGEAGARVIAASDVICAWGGQSAVDWAREVARPDAEVVRFGPKRSLAFVDASEAPRDAARGLAHDVCFRDQRACFSSQQAFIRPTPADLVPALSEALDNYTEILPPSAQGFDDRGARALTLAEARFLGFDCWEARDGSWAIIHCPPSFAAQHPLSRTVYLHDWPADLDPGAQVSGDTQTVALFPWAKLRDLRDAVCRAGVSRVVESGMSNVFRPGGAHDGMFPLQRLVRFASTELPSAYVTKVMTVKIEQTKFLEQDRFVEFIP